MEGGPPIRVKKGFPRKGALRVSVQHNFAQTTPFALCCWAGGRRCFVCFGVILQIFVQGRQSQREPHGARPPPGIGAGGSLGGPSP